MLPATDNKQAFPEVLGWQASKDTVHMRVAHIYRNEEFADVYFVVGRDENRQRIPAHKLVLSITSAVFSAMFNNGLADKSNGVEIEVTDVEPVVFLNMLQFIYSDEIELDSENVTAALYAAKKYGIVALEKACVDYLETILCAENALVLLGQGQLFDEKDFVDHCLEYIDKHAESVFAADSFKTVDRAVLGDILRRDSLRLKEKCVFSALCRWSEAECHRNGVAEPTAIQKREVLGELFNLIRFPIMTAEEFSGKPVECGMLSDAECLALFKYFHANRKIPFSIPFISLPRISLGDDDLVVSRFTSSSEYCQRTLSVPDSIMFSVNRDICITGFSLYKPVNINESSVRIMIQRDPVNVLVSHDASYNLKHGGDSKIKISLPFPVLILADVVYTASALHKVRLNRRFGTKGKVSVSRSSAATTFTFMNAPYSNNRTTVEQGEFPDIYFYTI